MVKFYLNCLGAEVKVELDIQSQDSQIKNLVMENVIQCFKNHATGGRIETQEERDEKEKHTK